jgi:GAF domain-containing protein
LERDNAVVGRYGGDEFLALIPNAGRAAAEQYCNAVLRDLSETNVYDADAETPVHAAASFGVAVYPEEAETLGDLIRLSDNAMYAQKQHRTTLKGSRRLRENGRVAKLLSDILPLLTAAGSRDEKLRLVGHQLRIGVGYDAVNFEVAGAPARTSTSWQRGFARAPQEMLEAWVREQDQAENHPLGELLERTRRPVFLADISTDDRLTETERELLAGMGLRSGLVVPMIWQERVVGMLSAASKVPAAFTSWDAQFLTAVSSQVTAIVFMTTLVDSDLPAMRSGLMRRNSAMASRASLSRPMRP